MNRALLWGGLAEPALLEVVLGHPLAGACATEITGWQAVPGAPELMVLRPGGATPALSVDLDDAAFARLTFYSAATTGDDVWVPVGSGTAPATVRMPSAAGVPTLVEAARETMRLFAHVAPETIFPRYAMMLLRASTRLRARAHSAPRQRRKGPGRDRVTTIEARQPYAQYFTVEEHDVAFPRFDGAMSSQITRAAFIGGDAVTVLPYDPAADRVLIIEQFRFAPHIRGDAAPWVLEPPAGRVDPGESPPEAALRELKEETGITAQDLLEIGSYYPSPGAWSEYLYSYVALCDLANSGGQIAGLAAEDEDIYSHILSFDDAMGLMQSGECDAGPLWLSLLWLAAHRAELRQSA